MRGTVSGTVTVAAALLGLSSSSAVAGTFSISPLRIELSQSTRTAAIAVRNHEAHDVVVQAEGLLWEQAASSDQLRPTTDLLVSPAVFTLGPKGTQIVRVALQRDADATNELNYRLLVSEVPQQASPDFTGLNVALRLSLPVFVAAHARTAPALQWSARFDADGQLAVTAHNAGTAHARVLKLGVAPAGNPATGQEQHTVAYVLPGRSRTWTFGQSLGEAVSGTESTRLRVKGTTEAGDFDAEITLARE